MEPFAILTNIIKPEYLNYYKDWIYIASEKEARGLQLIGAIYKHKGRKLFRYYLFRIKSKTSYSITIRVNRLIRIRVIIIKNDYFSFKKAEEMHRKN